MVKTKLIVWLWNPGKEYENSRHNIWFKIIDWISDYADWTKFLFDKKFNADISIVKDWKYLMIFAKQMTNMNISWESIYKILNFYKIQTKNLQLIHDELDLDPGSIKLKWNWWDNWHNWVKNIIQKLWTKQYWKLKIWIWRPKEKYQVVNYVLWKLPDDVLEGLNNQKDLLFEYVRQFLVAN